MHDPDNASQKAQKDYGAGLTQSKEETISPREQMLRQAIKLTAGDRNKTYGPPYQNMKQTAELFNAYLRNRPLARLGQELDAHDMAVFMILAKISRIAKTPNHEDSWTDIAAYAGIGHECAGQETPKTMNLGNSDSFYKGKV